MTLGRHRGHIQILLLWVSGFLQCCQANRFEVHVFLIALKLVIHVLLLGFGTLQAFLHACYTPGNLPLKSFPDSVANFSSILKQVKVRGTSRELRPVATPQQSASSSPMAIVPGMSDMMNKIEEQARALDALKNQMANSDKVSFAKQFF